MTHPGRLVLVVGPSGAGKDTLLNAAAERLRDDQHFVFPRRLVTREAVASLEDHGTLDRDEYDALVTAGDYTLCWEAHGLGYIIPGKVREMVAEGKIAVCNGSRRVVGEALERYPSSTAIIVTADLGIRAERLMSRGRETAHDIRRRLAREGAVLPEGARAIVVDNSGSLASGIAAFLDALRKIAERVEA